MTRLVSVVVVYFADTGFDSVVGALEREFLTRLEIGDHKLEARCAAARPCRALLRK